MVKKGYFIFLPVLTALIICILAMGIYHGTEKELELSGYDQQDVLKRKKKVLGFGILERLAGQWSGPVVTSTPMGNFDVWYVDFRPVSPGMIAQYTRIDKGTINFLTFLIVKHENQLKVAMRTEGVFQGKGCITYEIIEKADEKKGYYRFSDFKSGSRRAYTEFTFKGDQMIMETYTNKFNTVSPLELHSKWTARLSGREAGREAVQKFKFPQPVMVADFEDFFKNMSESIYFDTSLDPFSSSKDPHVGTLTVTVTVDKALNVSDGGDFFLLLTTKPLYEGITYRPENMKYVSKHTYLPRQGSNTFTFSHIHPGTYFLYSYFDTNNDQKHLSGDYMSSHIAHEIKVSPEKNTAVETVIDFVIP